ncbi:MAG TPA: hypothetical protein EYP04_04280, partial [Anaerolineae bacterium]|nr:hypothetical protein [Anaerolineae bacterium]
MGSWLMAQRAQLNFDYPPRIAQGGQRLLDGSGQPFFVMGVNYVGSPDRAWDMWRDGRYDLGLIEEDFHRAQEAGANALRLFIRQPLPGELADGRWHKLDDVIETARRSGIYLIITFADYPVVRVADLAELIGQAAVRYSGEPIILAFDLKNEPHYSDLATMRYLSLPPLQTDRLVRHYGQRVGWEEAVRWGRAPGGAPPHLSDEELYYYANGLELRREFLEAESAWVQARGYTVTIADYLDSEDAITWRPFLDVVDATLAAWIKPQVEAVRAADADRLITLGWSDAMLACLPANRMLDIVSLHTYPQPYPPARTNRLRYRLKVADALLTRFPGKPLWLEEFGYATHELHEGWAAIAETTIWLHLLATGAAGGVKWMLVDLPPGPNLRERSFGFYRADLSRKPSADASAALAAYAWRASGSIGQLTLADGNSGNVIYHFAADDACFLSGEDEIGDETLHLRSSGPVQLFAWWTRPGELNLATTAAGTVEVEPSALLQIPSLGSFDLLRDDGSAHLFRQQGDRLTFDLSPQQGVTLRLHYDRIDAKIEIVWPHGGAPVAEADKANITAYLFYPGSRLSVPCDFDPTVTLWSAINNEPAEPVATGVRRWAELGGQYLPVWDFNDVDVSAARNPRNKVYFQVRVDGVVAASNVWVHGVDARTYLPRPAEPTSVLQSPPDAVDARIQIVWPHENAPVAEAELANITVALYAHGTLASAPPDWSPRVLLYQALNNDVGKEVGVGVQRIVERDGLRYPVWDFNDVDVGAAKDPLNKVHFWVEVEGIPTYPTFWTHGADARTYFPEQDVPLG